jgi:hypothetical protein
MLPVLFAASLLGTTFVKAGAQPPKGDCMCWDCFLLTSKPPKSFCIESNQVYVKAHIELEGEGKSAHLYFDGPADDLGAGGAALPWATFDRRKAIAAIDLKHAADQGEAAITWIGFTTKSTGKPFNPDMGSNWNGRYHKK